MSRAHVYGPLVVDYTDIPHDGDTKELWTPHVGDVLLRLFSDWQTQTDWDHGALFVGQNVDGTVVPPRNVLSGAWAHDGSLSAAGSLDARSFGSAYDDAGKEVSATAYVFHSADPVQVQLAQSGGTDPTAGHVELYALIARPGTL